MSVLTKNERDGLEDAFLSIQSRQNKYRKIKEISSLIMSRKTSPNLRNLLKQAKIGLNKTKLSHLISLFSKKKKNLSK